MVTTQMKTTQALLFSEPLYTETGVWCELSRGLDPVEWASVCRILGTLSPREFRRVKRKLLPDPDSLINRFKRLFSFDEWEVDGVPVVSLSHDGLRQE